VESRRPFSDLGGIAGSISFNNHFRLRAVYGRHCWALGKCKVEWRGIIWGEDETYTHICK